MQQSQLGEYSGELLRVQIGNEYEFHQKKHSFPHYVRICIICGEKMEDCTCSHGNGQITVH